MLYLLFVENDNACLLKVLSIINLCLIKNNQINYCYLEEICPIPFKRVQTLELKLYILRIPDISLQRTNNFEIMLFELIDIQS